jgi:hypothetical protein
MRARLSSFPRTAGLFVVSIAFTLFPAAPRSEAQSANSAQSTTPRTVSARPLITEALDEGHLTVLRGNIHRLARPEFDLGTAPASLPMERMLLVLKRSPEQEAALRRLLDDQQDKASPNYHKWLTPTKFGQQFGPSDADVQTITWWLQSHGFHVRPTKGRTLIEFSGSASQVQEAFHTPIHKYVVRGEQHWANASDPQIPAALAPAMAGVFTLHDFVKKPQIHVSNDRGTLEIVPGKRPLVTFPPQNGQPTLNALGPQDYATIYNINPTYNAFINGNFITIGIVGRSNLFNGGQDVQDFRCAAFGICGGVSIILNGPDPGDLGGGEEAEATLDSTWAGSIAPGATVDLVVSATTNTTDGVDLSELYIVENNLADVMTESFGSCEYFATDAQVKGTSALAEQAAAQGITYLVSTGDNGTAGCDDPGSPAAAFPLSVNLLASTPFNVAVGGTMFNEGGQQSKYWGSAPPVTETAISYIPENVWNESCSITACGANANLSAGSGGVSSGDIGSGGRFTGFPKPAWQSGVTGIPNDNLRDLPDVSLTAASHDPYLLCLEGSCSQGFIYFVWGTSASAPSFAGIMALVDQQMENLYGSQDHRQGQANYVLYSLAASQITNAWLCNGSSTTTLPDIKNCIFNDTTIGNNAVPGELNYGFPNAKYQAGVGYDLATGLGSVNVANLVSQWNTVKFNPTITTLTLNNGSPVNITHGQLVNVNISVAASSGTGTSPTGDVSLLAANGISFPGQTSVGFFPLSGGTAVNSTNQLPGGTYNVTAHYAGDATYAPSDSGAVSVTVMQESSIITLSGPFTQDKFGLYTVPFTTLPFGSPVFIRANVQGTSGKGVPTGTVTLNATVKGIPATIPNGNPALLNSEGNASVESNPLLVSGPTVPFDAGQYTISATYNGDASFQPISSTQSVNFTIQPGFLTSLAAVPFVNISSAGLSGSIPINVLASSGFTSSVSFACTGYPAESTCTFGPTSITGSGQILVTVSTTAPHITQLLDQRPYYLARWLTGGGFALAGIFVLGSPRRRRHSLPLLLITLALLVMIPACGGGGGSHHQQDPGTPAGTYNVRVSATGGAILQTTSFTLSVQ